MKMSLAKISTKELKEELQRRKEELRDGELPLKDFYFFEEDKSEDDDDRIIFLIVTKRGWHIDHSTDDGAYDKHIRDRVPKGFYDIQESTFEYRPAHLRTKNDKPPTKREAIDALKRAGATHLKGPKMWQESLLVHMVKFPLMEKYYRVDVNVDTQKIKDNLFAWQKANDTAHENPDKYFEALREWAHKNNLYVQIDPNYHGDGCDIFVMTQKVWNSLPPYPSTDED
jgi:hypothetical protein